MTWWPPLVTNTVIKLLGALNLGNHDLSPRLSFVLSFVKVTHTLTLKVLVTRFIIELYAFYYKV